MEAWNAAKRNEACQPQGRFDAAKAVVFEQANRDSVLEGPLPDSPSFTIPTAALDAETKWNEAIAAIKKACLADKARVQEILYAWNNAKNVCEDPNRFDAAKAAVKSNHVVLNDISDPTQLTIVVDEKAWMEAIAAVEVECHKQEVCSLSLGMAFVESKSDSIPR